jgi:hypothetical protein
MASATAVLRITTKGRKPRRAHGNETASPVTPSTNAGGLLSVTALTVWYELWIAFVTTLSTFPAAAAARAGAASGGNGRASRILRRAQRIAPRSENDFNVGASPSRLEGAEAGLGLLSTDIAAVRPATGCRRRESNPRSGAIVDTGLVPCGGCHSPAHPQGKD